MNPSEREAIIQQMVLVTGYSRAVYDRMNNEKLQKEMERLHGKR